MPFKAPYDRDLYRKIQRGVFTIPDFLSDQCKNLIERILVLVPEQRLTLEEIKAHDWFTV